MRDGSTAKLTQQVTHFQFHILHHLANVGDVRGVVVHRHVLLHLTHHVTTEVQRSKVVATGAEVQDDGASELVVGGASAVERLEDVYAIPSTAGLAGWGDGCMSFLVGIRIGDNSQGMCATLPNGQQRRELDIHFFSSTQPAKPSSISQRYTLEIPPS